MSKARRWQVAAISSLVLVLGAAPARAQISGASASTAGSTGNSGNADGSTRSSVSTLINNGTTLQTRFAWNVSADVGALSTRDQSGNAQHNLSFNAVAPGGYRLVVTSQRVGMIQRNEDVLNCDGQAHTSGISGSQSGGSLISGSLNLGSPADIGNGGGDNQIPFNQSTNATIVRVSNGVSGGHGLTFTWNGSVRSNSCEAAVRQGEGTSVTSCGACEYPGSPSRTQGNDGHFVTVAYTSLCGNGVIDSSVGEQCDAGGANGAGTSCCNSNCTFRTAGAVCRASAGECDPQETCPANPGTAGACPADAKTPNGTACTSDGNPCTLDQCNGSSALCQHPAGNAGALCRASAGVCDVAETCTGASTTCPADGFASGATPCRPAAGDCDVAENCTGSGPSCPADVIAGAATVCRPSAGGCDLVEQCDGVAVACPADAFEPAGTECRADQGICDVAEQCDGAGPACPADAVEPAGGECRASAGVCDPAEQCDGSSPACPADAKSTAECRPSAGICDLADSCDGVNDDCPADAKSTAECRASTGACDPAESCDGVGDACPADALATAGTECRAAADACDVAESCDGATANCPVDGIASAGATCRAAAGACDVAETCDGVAITCPTDLFVPDGAVCDDADGCTKDDECTAGVCGGTPKAICLDHFNCYKAKTTKGEAKFVQIPALSLVDALENASVTVLKPKNLCTPADKNGEGVADVVTHLERYLIRQSTPLHVRQSGIVVENQIGQLILDTIKPDYLLVPTAKSVGGPQPPAPDPQDHDVDHYKCYKVRVTPGTPKFVKNTPIQVTDQFTSPAKTLLLKKPKHLCLPADKNGEGIKDPNALLVCYVVKPATGQPIHVRQVGLYATNQFGPERIDTIKEGEFCIPSAEVPPGSPSGAFLDDLVR